MKTYDGTGITMEMFKAAFPELYAAIVAEAQLMAPSSGTQQRLYDRELIRENVTRRLTSPVHSTPGDSEPWEAGGFASPEGCVAFKRYDAAGCIRILSKKRGGDDAR